jgi:hypothetical protein
VELSPPVTNEVGTQACVTATVLDIIGRTVSGADVLFSVEGTGISGTITSDASGHATFCYTGPGGPRTDTVTATISGAVSNGPYVVNPPSCPAGGLSYGFRFAYENGETLSMSPSVDCASRTGTRTVTTPGGQIQQVTVAQDTTAAGQPTQLHITTALSTPTLAKASPPTHLDLLLPAGMVRNGGSFATCAAPKLYAQGPNGCPLASRVGTGTAKVDASPVITSFHAIVYAFNASPDGILIYLLPELGPPLVIQGYPRTTPADGTIEFAIPPIVTLPGVGNATLTDLDLRLGATGAGGAGLSARTTSAWVAAAAPPAISAGPTGRTTTNRPTFTFSSADPGVTFECSLDGGPFTACTSPYTTPPLSQGSHTFAVRGRNAAGRAGPATTRTFAVASAVTGLAAPVIGKTVNLTPVKGVVLVRLPGKKKFVRLTAGQQVPVGTIVDATKGTVRLASAGKAKGEIQTAIFYKGMFLIKQNAKTGLTELVLKGGNFASCPKIGRKAATQDRRRKRKRSKSGTVRELWGDGSGKFRTTGNYSSATVRGTIWLVADRCDGTLNTVRKGSVTVRDLVRKRTIILKAPRSYLAKKRR